MIHSDYDHTLLGAQRKKKGVIGLKKELWKMIKGPLKHVIKEIKLQNVCFGFKTMHRTYKNLNPDPLKAMQN